jgi:methyl-accepting chemotaxis protein
MSRLGIRWKLLIVFTLLFTVAFALSYLWFYRFATRLAMDNLRGDLRGLAVTAASMIDLAEHQQVFESGVEEDALYTHIADQLRVVRNANPKVAAIYTMVRSPDPSELTFVVSADENPETRAHLREPYDVSTFPQMIEAFNGPTADPTIAVDEFGAWFSGYAPIRDAQGNGVAIVGVDMDAQDVINVQTRIKNAFLIAFILAYVAVFTAVFLISTTITNPLRRITGAASALEQGEQFQPERLERVTRGSDELGQLARVFSQMAIQVQAREQRLKQEVAQLRIEIDQVKKARQVAEITETDYFYRLRERAREIRGGADKPPAE